jgi:amino acid adenylation domain-containing protein
MTRIEVATADHGLAEIEVADRGSRPPLSLAQERVWFYDLLAPAAPFHNVPRLLSIDGPLRPDLLERAMNRVVERHAILRCTYHVVDGDLVQEVNDRPEPITVPLIDLRHLADEEREAELDRLAAELVTLQFDIERGPLIRAHLIRLAETRHVFLLDFHHIACDGWSERVTLNEIGALYDAYLTGEPDPLPDLPMQYFDYAVWQRARLASDLMRPHHDYWRGKLGEAVPTLALPVDRPEPPRRSYSGDNLGFEVPPALAAALREFAREHDVSLYMLMLCAFYVLLHRYTGQDDIVIGSPYNNRERDALHGLIGYFVTRLPLRVDLSGDPDVRELLGRVRTTVLEAFEHKETAADRWPYPRPDEAVRDSSNYRVMFFFQENPVGVERRFGGLVVTNANAGSDARVDRMGIRSPTLGSQLDLGLFIEPVGDRVFGWIEFATDIFDAATIVRMRGHLLALLADMLARPQIPVSRLNLLDVRERARLLPRLTGGDRPPTESLVLPALFAAQAARTPDAVAAEDGLGTLTFGELDHLANAMAAELVAAGVQPGDVVAIALRRSTDFLVALLGVLRAGAVAMPLDAGYPDVRLSRVVRQAGCSFAVSSHAGLVRVRSLGLTAVALPATGAVPAPPVTVGPDDPAFIFATSGSTGEPRLVRIRHHAAAISQLPDIAPYPLFSDDVLLFTAPTGSVRVVGESFWPWLAGARVAVAPDGALTPAELADLVSVHGATVMSVVPSLLRQVVDSTAVEKLAGLRLLQVLGEPLPTWLVRRTAQLLPKVQLVNSYAQTEACPALFRTARPDDRGLFAPVEQHTAISAGYVVDRYGVPQPYNVVGEIHIAGWTVADGYVGDESVSAAFGPDPYGEPGESRVFRTGDRGRLGADGTLEVIGRADNRVKVHGQSVALEDVEACLLEDDEISQVMVHCETDPHGDARLVALVVPEAGVTPSAQRIRSEAAIRLPAHMVPVRVIVVPDLPRTSTGKLDRNADLPAVDPFVAGDGEITAPRSETEQRVARLWAEVLGSGPVGVFDGFFELGGTSLAGIRLVSSIEREFGLVLNVRVLLEGRTVAGMAERVDALLSQTQVSGD